MQAVILMGGMGTRLQGLYPDIPKALVPVAGKPFLERQIEWLARAGVADVHLSLGYKADLVKAWLGTRKALLPRITSSIEAKPLGTGGGLKFVAPFIHGDPFLVLNGDSLLPSLDFAQMLSGHVDSGVLATVAVTRIEESGRYGTVEFDKSAKLTAFREKAVRESGWVNGGVYALCRAALSHVESGKAASIEKDVFPELASKGLVRAFCCEGPLLDMGTPEGLEAMSDYVSKRRRRRKTAATPGAA